VAFPYKYPVLRLPHDDIRHDGIREMVVHQPYYYYTRALDELLWSCLVDTLVVDR
jgi:hypothetical protein